MSKEKIDEYRRKHKRCKTCEYVSQGNVLWFCKAKGDGYMGNVADTCIKGCCCKLYKAKEFKE